MENKNKKSAAERDIEILLGVNPDFHGNRINPQALAKAEKLKEHAEVIRRINPKIVCNFASFEDKETRHWTMYMDIPAPFIVMAGAIKNRIADTINLANVFSTSFSEENGTVRFCYTVYNLWEE